MELRPETIRRANALAVQAFASAPEATDAVLALVQDLLGMQSVFLTRVTSGTLRVEASRNTDSNFAFPVGLTLPLELTP